MSGPSLPRADELLERLGRDGVAVLPGLLPPETLAAMQRAFAASLRRLRWNDFDGYEKTEPHRDMVQNVLLVEQGFVDLPLHPLIKAVVRAYVGDNYVLCEAKGWRSTPTREDFNGWHGDSWYDQNQAPAGHVPRELKLGFYLSDVHSGAFNYIKGSHGNPPRAYFDAEIAALGAVEVLEVTGPAGTAFLFDTSGIHRQGVPILEPRQAVFYNFHDPSVPLQQEDIDYYRYHPLLLNAAFLGDLDAEDQRVLGFGDKTGYIPCFERRPRHAGLQAVMTGLLRAKLRGAHLSGRVKARLRRMLGANPPLPPLETERSSLP